MTTTYNYVVNPKFVADINNWDEYGDTANVDGSWWDSVDTGCMRINNDVTSTTYGRKATATLPAGTYYAACDAQPLEGTTNTVFIVRRTSGEILLQQNWYDWDNNFSRKGGNFTVSSSTSIEVLCGVGWEGDLSSGSARFDNVILTEGAGIITYFDGDTTDTAETTYAWTATANASISSAVTAGEDPPLPPVDPVQTVTHNFIPNPKFFADINGWDYWGDETNSSAWWDDTQETGTLRINNPISTAYGRKVNVSLAAGTYYAAAQAQVLPSTTNTVFIVRRTSGEILLQQNWTTSGNTFPLRGGTFSLSTAADVEVLCGVGYAGANSIGSARFDNVILTEGTSAVAYFDGDTPDTDTITYAWTGTPNASTSTATVGDSGGSGGGGGGSTPPVTVGAFELVESFTFDAELDTAKWARYDGFAGTSGDGNYAASKVTVSDGKLNFSCNNDTIPAVCSKIDQIYGKWDCWLRWNGVAGFKPVMMLWPRNDIWAEGELDYCEMIDDTAESYAIYFHQVGNPTKNQVYDENVTCDLNNTSTFQKITIEWLPTSIKVYQNDVLVLSTTDSTVIPTTLFRWILQVDVGIPVANGGSNGVSPRPNYPTNSTVTSLVEVDRLDIYSYNPSGGSGSGGSSISLGFVETISALPASANDQFTATITRNLRFTEDILSTPSDIFSLNAEFLLTFDEATSALDDTFVLTVEGQPDEEAPIPPPEITHLTDRLQLLSMSGTQNIELTGWMDNLWTLRGSSGLFSPPIEINRLTRPFKAGGLTRSLRHSVRKIILPLMLLPATARDVISFIDRIHQIESESNMRYMILRYHHADTNAHSDLTVQVVGGLEISNYGENGGSALQINLELEAEDPYWRREQITTSFNAGDAKPWFPIFKESGDWLGGSAILGRRTVLIDTDIPTFPVWTVVGAGADVTLTNYTTNKIFAMSGDIASKDVVKIDTRDRGETAKTVTNSSGASLMNRVTNRQMWALLPSENDIEMSMTSTDENSYISMSYTPLKETP